MVGSDDAIFNMVYIIDMQFLHRGTSPLVSPYQWSANTPKSKHYNTERTGTSLPPLFMHQYLVKTSEPSLHLRDNLPTIFTNIPAHALIPPTLAWRYTRYRSSFHQVPLRSDLASRLYRLDVVPMCRRPYLFRRSCNFPWVCRLRNLLTNCACGCDREEF